MKEMERRISKTYNTNSTLLKAQRDYVEYMSMVKKRVEPSYSDFKNESDEKLKADKKKAYMKELRGYTIDSKKYKALVKKFTIALALANQESLDVVNDAMSEVYAMNYNQVADECKKVGIKVHGNK